MPKQKAHKGLRKRVKVTAAGKVKFKRSGTGHLMRSKNAKRRRRLSGSDTMPAFAEKNVRILLCE